jgi:hypothetical protein
MMAPVNIGRIADVSEILRASILKMEAVRIFETAEIQVTVTRCHSPGTGFRKFHNNPILLIVPDYFK